MPFDDAMNAHLARRRFWLRMIGISAAGVILPPVISLIGVMAGTRRSFEALGGETAGVEGLHRGISVSLWTTSLCLFIAALAMVLLVVSLIRFFRLPKPDTRVRTR